MRRYDVISEICDSMLELGWAPYQNDHEDANGQFEMNWQFADALTTADRQAFFKYMVKAIAEKHGLRATFMPKPFANLTGSGCHVHVSLWKGGKNLFDDGKDGLGLSRTAYNFIGGVMNAAHEMCSITNPTVNSYKRINAPVTTSGATWSPNTVTYTGNNRTHMIRIPGGGRFEFRLADGAANPYLLPAALLAAGSRRHRPQRRSRQAARYRHVCRRPQGAARHQEAAAQSARRAAADREVRPAAARARRRVRRLLCQAQERGSGTTTPATSPTGSGPTRSTARASPACTRSSCALRLRLRVVAPSSSGTKPAGPLSVAVSVAPYLSAHDLSVLIDFLLFAATLACVAIFHRHTFAAALIGLGVIILKKLLGTGFVEGRGLAGSVCAFRA